MNEIWRPGSFTKNFSWGSGKGLRQLQENIRIGFDEKLEDVPRRVFRERVAGQGPPDYIPINFFLFNHVRDGEDYLVVDELVFQAVTARHTALFDKLAVFAFNLSLVGRWHGAKSYQRRPALWAHHYVLDRVAKDFDWETAEVSADDIQRFVGADGRYEAEGERKLATNLNYFYHIGGLGDFATGKVERWWADSLFLALDRIIFDRELDGHATPRDAYAGLLDDIGFHDISGRRSLEKRLAAGHLIRLYRACGGTQRFSAEAVRRLLEDEGEHDRRWKRNEEPRAAIHPTNLRIVKTIPALCAMLAVAAGFDVLTAVQLRNFDPERFLRRKTRETLEALAERQVRPMVSAKELLRLTRGG